MDEPRDFFISYTGADVAWAEWIAEILGVAPPCSVRWLGGGLRVQPGMASVVGNAVVAHSLTHWGCWSSSRTARASLLGATRV